MTQSQGISQDNTVTRTHAKKDQHEAKTMMHPRPMAGPEACFHGAIESSQGGTIDVVGVLHIKFSNKVSIQFLKRHLNTAWFTLNSTCAVLRATIVDGDKITYIPSEQHEPEEVQWHTLDSSAEEFDTSAVCSYFAEKSETLRSPNRPTLLVMKPSGQEFTKCAFALRICHVFVDVGAIAMLLERLCALLAGTAAPHAASTTTEPLHLAKVSQEAKGMDEEQSKLVQDALSRIPLSQNVPNPPASLRVEETTKTGHFFHALDASESRNFLAIARRLNVTVTALMQAIIALRFGDEYLFPDRDANISGSWFAQYPVDCRPAMMEKDWIGNCMVLDFINLEHYSQHLRRFRSGDRNGATTTCAKEAMESYGQQKDVRRRGAFAAHSDQLMQGIGMAILDETYHNAKQWCHYYTDPVMDRHYLKQSSFTGRNGLSFALTDYQTILDLSFVPFLFFRTSAFQGRTSISLDYGNKFWADEQASQLFDKVVQDVQNFATG